MKKHKIKNPGLSFSLGYIGHKANKLQKLFSEYTFEENENGYFLRFEDFSELVNNQGVTIYTNCFTSKKHFYERLNSKLLFEL
jgi:hypothetical protein